MEATALYIRQEVILPNVGHHGEGFAPYLLTLFFFILAMNLLGLLPWGATATGNIAVTAALAVMAFLVIEVTGMRTLGLKGYLGTIFYLPPRPAGRHRRDHPQGRAAGGHDADRDDRQAGQAVRPGGPALRQHDLGPRAGAGADRAHLPVPELRGRRRGLGCSRPA